MNVGKFFCTLDIHKAYLYMGVDEDSLTLQIISTYVGIKTASNAWQRFMDQILNGLEGVVCFFDDIAV